MKRVWNDAKQAVLCAALFLLAVFGGFQVARACHDPYADPCPQGQECCPQCDCCVTPGEEGP